MSSVTTHDLLSRGHVDKSKRGRKLALGDVTNVTRKDPAEYLLDPNSSIEKMPGKKPRLQVIHPVAEPKGNKDTITVTGKTANWTSDEDEVLRNAVEIHKGRNWKLIAECLPNRTDVQCLHRWQKVLNPILVKGYWTEEEDERMIELVQMFGTKRWAAVARCLPGRNGKQCRERWCNHLDPQISREAWTEIEDMMLFLAHECFGNKWAEISKLLPGRSDNGIKNRWNTSVKKRAAEMEQCTRFLDMQNPVQLANTQHDPSAGRAGQDRERREERENSTFFHDPSAGRADQVRERREEDENSTSCQVLQTCKVVVMYESHAHLQTLREQVKDDPPVSRARRSRNEPHILGK